MRTSASPSAESTPAALLGIMRSIGDRCELPSVREFFVAPVDGDMHKSGKFAALVLEDSTIGLTYVALDRIHADLNELAIASKVVGGNPIELCENYGGRSGWQRALGMAAINAVSRWLIHKSGMTLDVANKTAGTVNFDCRDNIGMVGLFPPLVDQVRAMGIPLTVIELNESLVQKDGDYRVTTDSTALGDCNKVICTGTTLINHTIDRILDHCRNAAEIHVLGPSTGCLPDPLFTRGVTSVGGRYVTNHQRFIAQWRCDESWKSSSERFSISAVDYPGWEFLLSRAH